MILPGTLVITIQYVLMQSYHRHSTSVHFTKLIQATGQLSASRTMDVNLLSSFQRIRLLKIHSEKNGAQLEDRQEFLDGTKKWIMTPFPINQSQSRSRLSGGAIAGIVIACLVLIVLILLAVIMKCLKRHEERQNQHDEENPLSESLL